MLADADRELFLDPPPRSARSVSTAEWLRRLRDVCEAGGVLVEYEEIAAMEEASGDM